MELVLVLASLSHSRIISMQAYHSIMILSFLDEADHCLMQILLVILLVQYHNGIRDRHYLLCPAIVDPSKLPWRKIYENTDSTSFLHMTGLTRDAFFNYIFDVEEIFYPQRRGHPCPMGPDR
jgi:hypothetical protein